MRVQVDWEEHAHRDQEQLGRLIDAEPQDHERDDRKMRHVAEHLHRRVQESLGTARQAVQHPESKAERTSDREPERRTLATDCNMVPKLARQGEIHAGAHNGGRRRQNPPGNPAFITSQLPHQKRNGRQNPGLECAEFQLVPRRPGRKAREPLMSAASRRRR